MSDDRTLGAWFNPVILLLLAIPVVAVVRLRAWLRDKLS